MIDRPIVDMVSKPWGFEKRIINNEKYCGKLLYVVKGKNTSLHYHKVKDETFYVHSGKLKVYYHDMLNQVQEALTIAGGMAPLGVMECVTLNVGDALRIPPMRIHQVYAVEDTELYEFSTTHDEIDTVRLGV